MYISRFQRGIWAAALAVLASAAIAQPAKPVRIGLIGPFTGASADFG
jgi:hypothetical protein